MTKKSVESHTSYETVKHIQGNAEFILHPLGGMFWEEYHTLFISDTHFGKVTHFRKSGIAVPTGAIDENWDRLHNIIQSFPCKEVVFLGDLFHSESNQEWDLFEAFIQAHNGIQFTLVIGNHDILPEKQYKNAGITLLDFLQIDHIHFSHHPESLPEKYNIHGHVHPGVLMKGKGLGSKKIRCFFFGKEYGILPAFGSFTGSMRVPVKKGDAVYLLVDKKVIPIEK